MKILLLALLPAWFASFVSAHAQPKEQTARALLADIRQVLPEGWTASYDPAHSWLEVSRQQPVAAISGTPNLSVTDSEGLRPYTVAFRVTDLLTESEHQRLSAENQKVRKEMTSQYERLSALKISQKFDSFLPRTEAEKIEVARYEALKKALHLLPDFHFQDISLQWQFGSPDASPVHVVDDKIRKECTHVRDAVLKLLTPYPDVWSGL